MKRVFLVILSSLCASQAFATTYVRVEKDGTKTYSDRPLPGGQQVDLQPAQTYSAPPPPPLNSGPDSSIPYEQRLLQEMNDFRYTSCQLTPKADEGFTNPQAVSINVVLTPGLRANDVVDLKLDGASVGGPNAVSFTAPQPNRGAHSVSLVIKDRYGKTMCSQNTTFHVFRPSLNSPARR
jgi:Domain of unknown function (DUF4124)